MLSPKQEQAAGCGPEPDWENIILIRLRGNFIFVIDLKEPVV
jgi:hypothetical protein